MKKNAKITKWFYAFKVYANSYNVKILNSLNPELQLKDTESAFKNNLIGLLTELEGFEFVATPVLKFKKIQSDDKALYNTFYLNSKAETILNENDIVDVFMQNSLGYGSGWILILILQNTVP